MATPTSACGLSTALAMLSVAAAVHGQPVGIFFVDTSAPPGGNGAKWRSAFHDLQDALAAVSATRGSYEIHVAQGVYRPDRATGDRGASFEITTPVPVSAVTFSLHVVGGFAGLSGSDPDAHDPGRFITVLSGDLGGNDQAGQFTDNSRCVVRLPEPGPGLILRGLVISGGNNDGTGGASAATDGAGVSITKYNTYTEGPWLFDCRISGNRAAVGAAGVGIVGRRSRFVRCEISGNLGGPSACAGVLGQDPDPYSSSAFSDCRLLGNSGGVGGGLVCQGSVWMERCLIAENRSGTAGGGVRAQSGWMTLTNCVLVANRAPRGAALASGDHLAMLGCTVTGNQAEQAGAIAMSGFGGRIANSIVWGNSAPTDREITSNSENSVTVRSSILDQSNGALTRRPLSFWSLELCLDMNPRFRDAAGPDMDLFTWDDNDYRLSQYSPGVDYGEVTYGIGPTDVERMPRQIGPEHDISPTARPDTGAYEHQNPGCPGDFDSDGFVDGIDADRFNNAFLAGDLSADVNSDGHVDTIDYAVFYAAFEAGC